MWHKTYDLSKLCDLSATVWVGRQETHFVPDTSRQEIMKTLQKNEIQTGRVRPKKVAMLSTGGTIASVPGSDGRAVAGALAGERLLAQTELNGQLDVHVESVFQKASNAIGPEEWISLAKKC